MFYIAIVCFCRAHVEYVISTSVRLSHCLIPYMNGSVGFVLVRELSDVYLTFAPFVNKR